MVCPKCAYPIDIEDVSFDSFDESIDHAIELANEANMTVDEVLEAVNARCSELPEQTRCVIV